MGTVPIVRFEYPSPVCEGTPVTFVDSSYVEFGTINKWEWDINGVQYSSEHPPPLELTGSNLVKLRVGTVEGCVSEETSGTVVSNPSPSIDFAFNGGCVSDITTFTAVNSEPNVAVSQWYWQFGNGSGKISINPSESYMYKQPGIYNVELTGLTAAGCPSEPVIKSINVYQTNAFAGNDTVVAENQPFLLNGRGGEIYKWTPSTGLSDDEIANPTATLSRDAQFILTASTPAGCETSDTVMFKVFKGPALYVPSAFSPDGDGNNDVFKFYAVGMKSVDLFQVFNRYGQLIYSSSNIMGGWDGRIGGIEQPSGTYVWMIKGIDLMGTPHFKKGTVTLVR
jgi:gliding motility-associated-like protein